MAFLASKGLKMGLVKTILTSFISSVDSEILIGTILIKTSQEFSHTINSFILQCMSCHM